MRTLPSSLPSKYCHAPKMAPAVAHAASFCLLGIVLKTLFMLRVVVDNLFERAKLAKGVSVPGVFFNDMAQR